MNKLFFFFIAAVSLQASAQTFNVPAEYARTPRAYELSFDPKDIDCVLLGFEPESGEPAQCEAVQLNPKATGQGGAIALCADLTRLKMKSGETLEIKIAGPVTKFDGGLGGAIENLITDGNNYHSDVAKKKALAINAATKGIHDLMKAINEVNKKYGIKRCEF